MFATKFLVCCMYLSIIAVQIGFKQDSYTVLETDGAVTLCVNMSTGSSAVPVSLETIDIGSAQGAHTYTVCVACSPPLLTRNSTWNAIA